MRTSSKVVSFAAATCLAAAFNTVAIAQGMGPSRMQEGRGPGMMGPGTMQDGMGQGAMQGMGPGMMQGAGAGMVCPMMSGMMQGNSAMGPEMVRGMGALFGSRVTPVMNLSIEDVRSYLAQQLERLRNKRLKTGNVTADGTMVTADIVTVDNSLVQRLKIDRRTGAIEYEN